jgi:hypothetical protein
MSELMVTEVELTPLPLPAGRHGTVTFTIGNVDADPASTPVPAGTRLRVTVSLYQVNAGHPTAQVSGGPVPIEQGIAVLTTMPFVDLASDLRAGDAATLSLPLLPLARGLYRLNAILSVPIAPYTTHHSVWPILVT